MDPPTPSKSLGFLLGRVKASRQGGSAPPKAEPTGVPTRDGDVLAPTQPGLSHAYGVT